MSFVLIGSETLMMMMLWDLFPAAGLDSSVLDGFGMFSKRQVLDSSVLDGFGNFSQRQGLDSSVLVSGRIRWPRSKVPKPQWWVHLDLRSRDRSFRKLARTEMCDSTASLRSP